MPGKYGIMDKERKKRIWEQYYFIQKRFDDGMLENACIHLLEDMWGAGSHLHVIYESLYAIEEKALETDKVLREALETDNELREKVIELTARMEKLESSNNRPLSCKNRYEA